MDAADGPNLMGDGSEMSYVFLHHADDTVKLSASHVTVREVIGFKDAEEHAQRAPQTSQAHAHNEDPQEISHVGLVMVVCRVDLFFFVSASQFRR